MPDYLTDRDVLRRAFACFPDDEIVIIGSACRDLARAGDIDVLFLATVDWPGLMARLGTRYSGWDHRGADGTYHVRRARTTLPGVEWPIDLLTHSNIVRFTDFPFCCVYRDGTRQHEGVYFRKPARRRE